MSENTKLWDMLGRTDPKHTKGFTRGGGFRGTAIKPMWSYRRMTEEFGPCGVGWGVGEPSFHVHPGCDGELLVYCTASVWYRIAATPTPEAAAAGMLTVYGEQNTVYGVGGDKVVNKFQSGLKSDDEAFKKAYTDAITNALKMIGVGADVHMGLFDDSKYVNTMREEFSDGPSNASTEEAIDRKTFSKRAKGFTANGERTAHAMRQAVEIELRQELAEVTTTHSLEKLWWAWAKKVEAENYQEDWKEFIIGMFKQRKEAIINGLPDDDQFPGDPGYISTLQAG